MMYAELDPVAGSAGALHAVRVPGRKERSECFVTQERIKPKLASV